MKKRVLTLLLTVVMCTALCACGGDPVKGSTTSGEEKSPAGSVTESTVEESTVTERTVEESKTEEVQESQSAASSETSDEEAALTFGSVNGSVYVSDWAGLKVEFDETWVLANEEQLAQMNGYAVDTVTDDNLKTILENSDLIYDMYAQNLVNGSSMNVIYQKVNPLMGAIANDESIVDANLTQYKDILLGSGYQEVSVAEKRTMTIAGQEKKVIYCEATIQNVHVKLVQFFYLKGNYIWCATVGLVEEMAGETTIDELMAMFEAN